jgi:hypothetical protein
MLLVPLLQISVSMRFFLGLFITHISNANSQSFIFSFYIVCYAAGFSASAYTINSQNNLLLKIDMLSAIIGNCLRRPRTGLSSMRNICNNA